MPKYRVSLDTVLSVTVTVEADDPEQAKDKAFEENGFYLCAQCAGWGQDYDADVGEFEISQEGGSYGQGGKDIEPELVE